MIAEPKKIVNIYVAIAASLGFIITNIDIECLTNIVIINRTEVVIVSINSIVIVITQIIV